MDPIEQPPRTIFSLGAITRRLKELLVEVESKRFWVQAHFVSENAGKLSSGHCYASLVENDENGRSVARMRAVIWRNYRQQIKQKLRDEGCKDLLGAEQEICALSAIRFHPVYGLRLEICDVDPTTRCWNGSGRPIS